MPRSFRWTLAFLCLALLGVTPAMAGEAADVAPATLDTPSLEIQLQEPPIQTPAPAPEDIQGSAKPGQDLFFEALRYCETPEEFAQCPSHCFCVVSNNIVYCSC